MDSRGVPAVGTNDTMPPSGLPANQIAAPLSAASGAPPIRLWRPRDVAVASIVLGFPAGIALAAANWFRMGRFGRVAAGLGLAASLAAGMYLLPPSARSLGLTASVVVGLGLARFIAADRRRIEASGRGVASPTLFGGVVVMGAVWLLAATAAGTLSLLDAQAEEIRAGTVEVGTGGSGCTVTGQSTAIPASSPIHLAARLQRDVVPGEVVHATVGTAAGELASSDLTIGETANCISGDLGGGLLMPGAYQLDYSVAGTSLARGTFEVIDSSASVPGQLGPTPGPSRP